MPENKNTSFFSTLLYTLYLIFFVSLIFSFRAVCSISMALILIAGIIKNKTEGKDFFNANFRNPLLLPCCLFFFLQFISLLYTHNIQGEWKDIMQKSSLLVVPLALCSGGYIYKTTRQKLLNGYCLTLFVATLFALYTAYKNYTVTKNPSVFVYHSLVKIYSGHAIQFSILVFVALLHLFEGMRRKEILLHKVFHIFLSCFFSAFLLLLSSKLVIVAFLLYLIYYAIKTVKNNTGNKPLVIFSCSAFVFLCMLIFFTTNPISKRFKEIMKTDFTFIEKEKFSPGDYFNGLQFRLLQWKFVPDILNKKKAWLLGVSPGDAQYNLNQKYISEDMYVGTPERGDKGFLGYNTHNQFLEALLQSGIVGLIGFLLICLSMVRMAWQRKKNELSFITVLLLAYSFSESVLETQYSLLIFLFFPLFFYLEQSSDPV